MDKENEDLWCNYSDLPSPMAYAKCADYDSMGNHGRFPKKTKKNMKKLSVKKLWFILTVFFSKFKKKRKTIWEL